MKEQAKFVSIFSASLFLAVASLYSEGYVSDAFQLLLITAAAMVVIISALALARKWLGDQGDE